MAKKNPKPAANQTAYKVGAAIRREKVAAQFRKMSPDYRDSWSSTHNIQRAKLEGSVLCVIDRPLNYIRTAAQQRNLRTLPNPRNEPRSLAFFNMLT